MSLTAHVLVKNEEIYIKKSILSVLPFVDKMIIFDTGSKDSTVDIIKEIVANDLDHKITLEQKGLVDKNTHTDLRNEMVKMTTTDWFMVLDGDEVWPKDQIEFAVKNDIPAADKLGRKCIMAGYHLCSVDLMHYTERGHFGTPWGLHGHFTYRFFKNSDGISWGGEYGLDDLIYSNGTKVVRQENLLFSTSFFWHLSKLKRSSLDEDVMGRKKPSSINFLPKFIKKFIVLDYKGKLPDSLL